MYISEMRNFRLLPEYENDIMLSMKRDGNYMLVKTYSRNDERHGPFYVDAAKLSAWMDDDNDPEFWDKECGNILRITYNRQKYTFILEIWWMSSSTSGKITGTLQRMEVDAYTFNQAMVRDEWQKTLCKENDGEPVKFIWTESANRVLRGIQQNKTMKRALCKALAKGVLSWPNRTITFYSDFAEGSFFFREDAGICGGLICHKSKTRNGYDKYEYQSHT